MLPFRKVATLLVIAAASACAPATPPASPAAPPAATTQAECVPVDPGSGCLPVAPQADRVDLAAPVFSNPTRVDNPLHPTGLVHSALLLGESDGEPFRAEVTLLEQPKTITWNGQQIQALESQYVAFLDGRLQEVALDWFAQADDGSVWYLGEDVFNYRDGVVADTHGTWQAGRDGPAAMIMPANPQVGDVYRPENIPGIVFEEVTVQSTGVTVDGPRSPVTGAIVVSELHMEGTHETKTFAPGYGEFLTGGGADVEALAVAVPTDSLEGPMPAALTAIAEGAAQLLDALEGSDWSRIESVLAGLTTTWEAHAASAMPPLLRDAMIAALASLAEAVEARTLADVRQGAWTVVQASLDLQLQYRPPDEIDLDRLALWAHQLQLDAAAQDAAAVAGDVATLDWLDDRIAHTLPEAAASALAAHLAALRAAAAEEDFTAAASQAEELRQWLAGQAAGG